MEIINDLMRNKVLIVACLGYLISGILKVFIDGIVYKRFSIKSLIRSGGMPSSHTATVVSLAVSLGLYEGFSSYSFATATILAIIVIHDAVGVRRETGRQAEILNKMMFESDAFNDIEFDKHLKEFVGHTPTQVFFGAIVGILVGIIFSYLLKNA